MPEYRFFLVEGDHHIVGAHTLTCADDEDAIVAARRFAEDREVEVWQGERKVARLKPGAE